MKLYHGTSTARLAAILETGILPRRESKKKSLWSKNPSADDRVYLSDIYAPYFAFHAAEHDRADALILEVDTDRLLPTRFLPDEDFLEQASRKQSAEAVGMKKNVTTLEARTRFFRQNTHRWRSGWTDSVKHLGTCAVQGRISPEAITRYVTVDCKKMSSLRFMATDASISIINHTYCSGKYTALTALLMGDRPSARQWVETQLGHGSPYSELEKMFPAPFLDQSLLQATDLLQAMNTGVQVYNR